MPHRILVVDDEAPIRELLTDFFSKHGFRVSAAGLAEEARRLANQASPDLIVLDMALADTDGMDLLVALKAAHAEIPIIILTGMGLDDEILREALEKGASGYISKTDPLELLLAEARRLLGGPAHLGLRDGQR
jgi:DNA-binding response OmpR family regulator